MLKAKRKEPTEQRRFPAPRMGVPEDPRPFVGSGHLVAAAAIQQLLTARCLVAVVGPLGSGKSTTCRRAANSRWARQWYLHDEGGQPVHRRFWADLEDCHPGAETQEKIAQALGRATFEAALGRLRSGKPCLLVLDNADQAFAAGGPGTDDTLAELAASVPRGASVVVTRRSVADLIVDRPWTDVIEIAGFGDQHEAKELFEQLAPRHAGDPRADPLVAACDQVPLAVSLLARAAADSDLDPRPDDSVPSGLDFALEVVTAALDAPERHAWVALSLFPSGLGSDDIAAVIGGELEPTIRLHEIGLARRCDAGVRVPAPLRRIITEPEVVELWEKYVRRAQVVLAVNADPSDGAGLAGPGGVQAADAWLTRQRDSLNILFSRPDLPEGTLEMARMGLLGHRSGIAPDTLDRVLVGLIGRAVGGPVPDSLASTAAVLEDQRRFGTSALLATALVEAHRRASDTAGESAGLRQLGRAERFCGRYDDAEAHLRLAQERCQEQLDEVGEGSALFELGQIDVERGRLDAAEEHLEAALALFAANDRPVGEANVNVDLVRVDLARGRLASAESRLAAAVDRYEVAGHKLGSANAQLQLGQLELARAQLDAAERHFEGALDSYEQAGDKVGFANAFLQLGQVDLARGRLANADRRFGAALAGYQRVGDIVGQANASLQLGQIDLALGRLESAAGRLSEALAAYEQLGDQIGRANASLQLGQVHLRRGELPDAETRLRVAQGIYDDIGDPLGSANSRHIEALLLQAQRRRPDAMSTFAEAARLYSALGRSTSAAWSLVGAATASTGRSERTGYAGAAVKLLEAEGLTEAAAQVAAEFAKKEAPPAPVAPVPRPVAAATEDSEPAPVRKRETKRVPQPAPKRRPEPRPAPPSGRVEVTPAPAPGPVVPPAPTAAPVVASEPPPPAPAAASNPAPPPAPAPATRARDDGEPQWDWDWHDAPVDPRDLIRVAHGDPDPDPPPEAAGEAGTGEPAPAPQAEAAGRHPRFRLGRKKDRG
jgi:tetratricopeptide (TPR) repeat protein